MAEIKAMILPANLMQFRTIIGRLLVSKGRAQLYFSFNPDYVDIFVYDEEIHEVKMGFCLERAFFEELECERAVTLVLSNPRFLFEVLNFSLGPSRVT